MELIFFQKGSGEIVVGRGPFENREEPPAFGNGEVGFYLNDYSLSEGKPWWVPASWDLMTAEGFLEEFGGEENLQVGWNEPPRVDGFAAVFGEVMEEIRAGHLEKAVPVVVERGRIEGGDWASVLRSVVGLKGALRFYGWIDGENSVVGATPEVLFAQQGQSLSTMALAGTARGEEKEVFDVDEKEIREHEFVSRTLMAKLSDVGVTRRKTREVMDLGELVHFHTPIEVELFEERSSKDLIRRLHPTPALGPLPRTSETIEGLVEWRERLGCPSGFGAPFGLCDADGVEVLVAIRMIYKKGEEVLVPSGCGVIEESRLTNEWRELRLKREAVKGLFGV